MLHWKFEKLEQPLKITHTWKIFKDRLILVGPYSPPLEVLMIKGNKYHSKIVPENTINLKFKDGEFAIVSEKKNVNLWLIMEFANDLSIDIVQTHIILLVNQELINRLTKDNRIYPTARKKIPFEIPDITIKQLWKSWNEFNEK